MTTKKQKRQAGEQRRQEQDAKHTAEIQDRKRVVNRRSQRRAEREMQQVRRASTLSAIKALKGGAVNG